ncbi:MAG: high-affinity branched-chain amino acid ABC transporter substrate-binding protein [Bordetella sp.]|nr:MAG: high-affinity branched-chain amino acid ABC transporter substrate-binding protein [Bordetella sp.]
MLPIKASSQSHNILIGVVGPNTGSLTQYGDMIREGVDTAIEHINAFGGINGKNLETVMIDDGCEPKQGSIAANRILNKKINFVIGPVCSGATIAVTDIYNKEGVIMITPSATAPLVTDGKNYSFIFRTIGRDDQQGPSAANFIIKKIRPQKIAILHDKQSYGQGIASSVKTNLEKNGLIISSFEGINIGENDFSSIITKLKSMKVDFVYFGGYYPEMGLLLRQASEQGFKARFMGPEGVGNEDINIIAGEAVEGMFITLPKDFSKNPLNYKIVKDFVDKKRNAGGVFQLTAYSATQVIADAIRNTGSMNTILVSNYLHQNIFDTPIGNISWNSQGDLTEFNFDVYCWHKDGSKSLFPTNSFN